MSVRRSRGVLWKLSRDGRLDTIPNPVTASIQDLALVEAMHPRGDSAAFEALVRRYDRKLLRIAQQVTHDIEDAQDAVQEAFLKALSKTQSISEDHRRSATWLIRIALNRIPYEPAKAAPLRYRSCLLSMRIANGENVPLGRRRLVSECQNRLYSRAELQEYPAQSIRGNCRLTLRVVFVLPAT